MKQFSVTGMTCAACQSHVEKAVSKVSGVSSCSVSLLTNSMSVDGDFSDSDVISAVEAAGYGAAVRGKSDSISADDGILTDRETPLLKKRLISSLVFLLVLMYFSMGHSMLGLPLPAFFDDVPAASGLLQLLLCAAVMIINKKFFVSGAKSLMHGSPNMDTLVSLGSGASFVRSVYALFGMLGAEAKLGTQAARGFADGFYFESAAMILTLITVGKLLEARSKGKTTDVLKALLKLSPDTAAVIRDGNEISIPAEEVQKGDIFVVRPGESVPVDGIVLEGFTAVNEAALTGESIPVDKSAGDTVHASAVNQSGYIKCRATGVGEETVLAQVIKTVTDATATKAPIAKTADKVAGIFVPAVMCISLITLAVWLILGKGADHALTRAISVLVISCPCALGLATPVAVTVGSGVGAKNGILFKTAEALEAAGKANIAVLDKTGTVTKGTPEVCGIFPLNGHSQSELLETALTAETKSEHPLARAIVAEAEKQGAVFRETSEFSALPGNGVAAVTDEGQLYGGSLAFISAYAHVSSENADMANSLSDKGQTPVLFAKNGELLGVIAVADSVKDDSAAAVAELKDMGLEVVMLTGDNMRTARAVAEKTGIKNVIAGVLPDEKAAVVSRLKKLGNVLMAGDGINDAPALTLAHTGVAMGSGTDIAAEAADIVLMKNNLRCLPAAIRLSRAVLANIRENLFWAFIYNIIGIPLAAGCFAGIFGWELQPVFGAAAMSLSSFCVVSNALRLNLFRLDRQKRTATKSENGIAEKLKKLTDEINSEKEVKHMTKTLKIEGMMCPRCEAHVKKALEEIDGVISAQPSFQNGTAVVTLGADVGDSVLIAAVEAQDYKVLSVEK